MVQNISSVKQLLIGSKVGIFAENKLKEELLKLPIAIQEEIFNIISASTITKENFNKLIEIDLFKPDMKDFDIFEKQLIENVQRSFYGRTETLFDSIEHLYKFIRLKQNMLNLTSNDLSEPWFTIIDDYELRNDGLPGRVKTMNDLMDLIRIINMESC